MITKTGILPAKTIVFDVICWKGIIMNYLAVERIGKEIIYLVKNNGEMLLYHSPKDDCDFVYSGDGNSQYLSMAHVGKRLFAFPYYGNNLIVYDVTEDRVDIEEFIVEATVNNRVGCSAASTIGKMIYITCGMGIIAYDTEKMNGRFCLNIRTDYTDVIDSNVYVNVYHDIKEKDGQFWVPLSQEDTLIVVDVGRENSSLIELPRKGYVYNTAVSDGNYVWMSGEFLHVVKWNKCNKGMELIKEFPDGFKVKKLEGFPWKGLFFSAYDMKESIVFTPLMANMFISLNKETGKITPIHVLSDNEFCFCTKMDDSCIYGRICVWVNGNVVSKRYFEFGNDQYIEYDTQQMHIHIKRLVCQNLDKASLLFERYEGMLHSWIDGIC